MKKEPKPATKCDDRPSKRPSIEHGEDYLPDEPHTSEWTAKMVREIRNKSGTLQATGQDIAVARAHNAELAAERERHGDEMTSVQLQLNRQLAAEREKVVYALQLLMESSECIAACFRTIAASDDKMIMDKLEMNLALAGVKNGIGVRLQAAIADDAIALTKVGKYEQS
jgi:hypothetical protein